MTGQHRKPGQTVYFDASLPEVRKYIDAVVAKHVNDVARSLRAVREWCDDADKVVCSHQSEHECVRCEAIKDCAAAVRTLLPDVPPSVGEVEQVDGTRVTPGEDREY